MCETYDLPKSQCGSGVCFFSRFRSAKNAKKDQGRDIPPNAEPAASPRRLQLGQLASTLQPTGRVGQTAPNTANKDFPHMVLQPDFRKVSGISTEIFRQLETVENDHDATTAAALGAVERRGEMLVRMLDPRQFSRPAQETVRKLLSMQDALHAVHFVEIVKRPGQTLGLYIREGNGLDRYDGVFISRIAIESAVFNSGCLGVGDEILAVNLVDVTHMSLDDVVILMSIPRRLVLTIRQRKGQRIMSGPTQSILRTESKLPPVVVIKKELGGEDDGYEDSNGENGHIHSALSHQYFQQQVNHYANLSHGQLSSLGRGRTSTLTTMAPQSTGGRLFSAGPGPPSARSILSQQQGPHSIQSLPRHYQPSYANLQLQHLPDVTDYARMSARHEDFRLEAPQPPIRRPQYSDYYDQMRPDPPPRPSSQQGGYLSRHDHGPSSHGPASTGAYDWYRSSLSERGGAGTTDSLHSHHAHAHAQHHLGPSSLQQHDHPPSSREMTTASISYQPPPPVITEQPRSIVPAHFQPFDRAYPKTLESLAEKVHTFYTGPRPVRHHGPHGPGRSSLRMPRTGSDHRLSISSREHNWYGSMPRQRTGDYRSLTLQQPLTPSSQAQAQPLSARYSTG
ncbi:unnamed protein product [Allacma fusca]|uniref:PDZ domain-containing protein n=1 Tax=Allacma fusca TaxID=39272 RepID=A0A8J2JYV7_9HEXA|nr:unnamed protein product [Allacma fusca]